MIRFFSQGSLVGFLLLAGCSIARLSPEGSKVHVVSAITATDLVYYDLVGEVECIAMLDEENCLDDMKNKAASLGATVILVKSRSPGVSCSLLSDRDKTCISMKADAYRRKPEAKK
jgi:hypothetical protein